MSVAVYVQRNYARATYAVESYEVRQWPGLELIVDDLRRNGIEVGYCSDANVHQQKVVLVSIISAGDWYSFLAERLRWKAGDYTLIVGGSGLSNIRAVLPFADVFVLGRGEGLTVDLVRATLRGERLDHPSVVYADEFSMAKTYRVRQAPGLYPHACKTADGTVWTEQTNGCQRRCLFCHYTWTRKHIGVNQHAAGASDALYHAGEVTMLELDLDDPASWCERARIVGLDGSSERIRHALAKPITRERFRRFLSVVANYRRANGKTRGLVKVYNILGVPTETEDDWHEIIETAREADSDAPHSDGQRLPITIYNSHFKPFPATPCAAWPVSKRMFRDVWPKTMRRMGGGKGNQYTFFVGKRFALTADYTIESLSTVMLDLLVMRGEEQEQESVRRLALTPAFWSAKAVDKAATLLRHTRIEHLMREYRWDELPARNIETYVASDGLRRAGERGLRMLRGVA